MGCCDNFIEKMKSCKNSPRLVLIIVFVALFCDNMLLTVVVPIIPDFLFRQKHPELFWDNATDIGNMNGNTFIELPTDINSTFIATTGLPPTGLPPTKKFMFGRMFHNPENSHFHIPENYSHFHFHPPKRIYHARAAFGGIQNDKPYQEMLDEYIANENIAIGFMFASNGIAQMITNCFLGPITQRIGYSIPIFVGFIVLIISTLVFAFATSYTLLFLARFVQGIGSACNSTAGMAWLAYTYPNDEERGSAMGMALGGLALGVLLGPVFGGFMYDYFGKELPFLILAVVALIDGLLQLFALQPKMKPETTKGNMRELLQDPLILIVMGALLMGCLSIIMLDPTMPLWMIQTLNASPTEQGFAFLPAAVAFAAGTAIFGYLGGKMGRWLCSMIGFIVLACALVALPFSKSFWHLLIPMFLTGVGNAMIDSTMMPTMGFLVDTRHVSAYGNVYALADLALATGYAGGPALAGPLAAFLGFDWMCRIFAIVCVLFAPLMFGLRNVKMRSELEPLIDPGDPPIDYSAVPLNGVDSEKPTEELKP